MGSWIDWCTGYWFLVQVRLGTEVLHTSSLTRPGFKLMTSLMYCQLIILIQVRLPCKTYNDLFHICRYQSKLHLPDEFHVPVVETFSASETQTWMPEYSQKSPSYQGFPGSKNYQKSFFYYNVFTKSDEAEIIAVLVKIMYDLNILWLPFLHCEITAAWRLWSQIQIDKLIQISNCVWINWVC